MRNLVLISIALCVMAVAASQLLDSSGETGARTVAREVRTNAVPAHNDRNSRSGDVEIEAEADGHFYVEAKINGRAVDLMVDTGATAVTLRESDARRAGIRVSRSDFDIPFWTANGSTYAAPVTFRRISIDRIEIHDVRGFVLSDEQLHISLLGATFLNELERFEVSNNILVLEN